MKSLPKDDYDIMVGACDVGMIFLDHRFTIPNFPSRILSYMQAKLPVLAVTDPNTDIGQIIINGRYGWWCESNNTDAFKKIVDSINEADICSFGNNSFDFLINNYSSEKCYKIIEDYSNLTGMQKL